METDTCETQTETAVEILNETIHAAISFVPEKSEEEPKTMEDTWLGRFGNDFSAVCLVYNLIKLNSEKAGYEGPTFASEQIAHIDAKILAIKTAIAELKSQFYSIEKILGQKEIEEVPIKIQRELLDELRSMAAPQLPTL